MYKFLYFVLVVIVTAGFWVALRKDMSSPICLIPHLGGIILTVVWAIWCKPGGRKVAISILLSLIPGFGPLIAFFILVGETPDYIGKSKRYWISDVEKAKQQQKVAGGFCGVILLIVLGLAAYSGIRYWIDHSHYNKGHQSYLEMDCINAIVHYDKVLAGFRLFNLGGFPQLIEPEKEECIPLQVADYNQQSGNFSQALVNYVEFALSYTGSVLKEAPRNRIALLFDQPGPTALASVEACQKIPDLLANQLLPQPELNLPLFYFACGQVYDEAKDAASAFTMYTSLLAEFPQHAQAEQAEAALLVNLEACKQAGALQQNPIISQRDAFMPSLYVGCSQKYTQAMDEENAFAMQLAFLNNFPNHPDAVDMEKALLANPASCAKTGTLEESELVNKRANFLPTLYYSCGLEADRVNDPARAFSMYKLLLQKYPQHPLSTKAEASLLDNPEACNNVASLQKVPSITGRSNFMLNLYFNCGKYYDRQKNSEGAFTMYSALLAGYPEHPYAKEAETALLSNPTACARSGLLKNDPQIAERPDFMLTLYYNCAKSYDQANNQVKAFEMYKEILEGYPEHAYAAEAESALLSNATACDRSESLNSIPAIKAKKDFMPMLYFNCGQIYAGKQDWKNAMRVYERFLADYPKHKLAREVETALAGFIIENARASGAGEIPPPSKSGSVGGGVTLVEIQNDSPESLRIVFSGPEARVEYLPACETCTTYSFSPLFCPEQGPIGKYSMQPGEYAVVVESTSDTGTTPWLGNWTLVKGDKYYSCFIIITSFSPD